MLPSRLVGLSELCNKTAGREAGCQCGGECGWDATLAFPRERRLGTKLAGNEGAIVLSHEQELWLNPQLVQSARCTGSRHRLYSCRPVDEFLQKLNPVSKRIRGVEAARPRNRVIPDDLVTGLDKAVAK